ncbi:putative electron transport protein YccM [Clostridium homopropionicum DSM 5847]|uniref:Putative electron transport protein YccM n=1 Tax=Clostridium homopropionicum DSM 5847 TaxID=1121318 RepID=A0A0L6ZBB6_9CLOT|nr:4Fe-4S dicluster domain-containing protein [Clostridium homopropionicum]KOA20103.1 putative electron transport protein YccM [Clostridium homopropionicum DSM 5847]SFG98797.1 4Fe-4S dicluster domain-containing protein [Clostridium homopropionicum]
MPDNKTVELKILKAILCIYIVLCIIIAGLNYGYASKATPEAAAFITWFWHFYENWIKTIFIIVCSFLTLRIVSTSKINTMRKRNLIGFIIAALVVHIVTPLLLNNSELYFFTMPLPWTTTPLQLLRSDSTFYISRFPVWGAAGVLAALIFYICISIIVLIGTLLFGRRWQCSTLCLFNGFAAEVFEPAIPLVGKNKKLNKKTLEGFSIFRWASLAIAVFFTLWWIMFLSGTSIGGNISLMGKVENYKYLTTELLMAMFFWVAFIGRGYCYYCPLGTVLGLISKIAGQRIITDKTKCVQCGKCNETCPMFINIKDNAKEGKAVAELRCVGCGHCVDVCPTRTLGYSTRFLKWVSRKKKVTIEREIDRTVE